MRRLKPHDTFSSIYEKALKTQKETGLMSRAQVILLQVLFAQEAGVCDHCGIETALTADHIVPAMLLKMLGYNVEREFRIEWYQCLCWPCNREKGIRVEWDNYRTRFILLQIMCDKPTWEYAKLAKQHADIKKRFEEGRQEVVEIRGPKRLMPLPDGKFGWGPLAVKGVPAHML